MGQAQEEDRIKWEEQMQAKERNLRDEQQRAKMEFDRMMKDKLDQEQRMQQFREIDARLQEVVPKIAEINTICREVYRENITYEPDIQTEVR